MNGTTLTVRPTTSADMAEVDALFQRSYPALLKKDYPPSTIVTAIPLISRANPRLLASGTYYAVLDADGAIVGAGGWTTATPPNLRGRRAVVAHVRHVVTDFRRTREGIGRRLMSHALAEARAAGIRLMECQSTLTARRFYAAMGFEEVGPINVLLRPGIDFPAIQMRQTL